MKEMKKILSFLLCVVMVLGMFPAGILTVEAAEGDPTVVIAGSDYQNTNGGLFSSGASTDAYAIMSQIKEDYASAYGFLFGGDYYAHSTNTTTESTNGKNQLKGEIVDVLYPDMADDTQIYIQGNHDADSLTTNGTLATSGAHDTDYYGVYVINEKDYMWYNDNQSTIQSTASALESYLDAKLDEGYTKPIFVLSHLPLHFSTRTVNDGDGKYAKYIYDVLDEAGANDLNIIFLYGHNHSTSYYEAYLGNAAVYLAEGDTIYVANEGSQSSCFSDTLNFTYMNYGFTGYLSNSTADGALTMTVFEIYEDEVQVKRYDESGVHNLKSAGVAANMPSGVTANTTVYTSPQTIELTTPAEKTTLTSGDVTVTAIGITEVTASKAEAPTYNSSLYSGYEEYTVSAPGLTGDATITIALTDGDFDTTRSVTVKFPDGHTEDVAVVNGTVTVESDTMGTFTLMQKVQTTIEVPGESETTTKTVYRLVDTLTDGKSYILATVNAAGNGYAVRITSSNGIEASAVTVLSDSTGAYIDTSDSNLVWEYAVDSTKSTTYDATVGYLESVATSGRYLNISNSAFSTTTSQSSDYVLWRVSDSNGKFYATRTETINDTRQYPYYSSGFKFSTSSSSGAFYLYEEVTTEVEGGGSGSSVTTSGGDWVTITEPTGGSTTVTYKQDTDGVNTDTAYLIVNSSSATAMENNGTSGITTASISVSGTTATTTTRDYEWMIDSSNRIYTTINGTTYYLSTTGNWNYSLSMTTSSSSATQWTISNNNGAYTISASLGSYYSRTYYLTTSGLSTSSGTVRLFAYEGSTTTGGTAGQYGKLDGELEYTVPYGTSEAVALQKVKDGIAIKYATASDYSDEATFADDGEGMTWEVVNYDGSTAGEYAVNISYNGTLLGTAKIIVNPKPAGTAQVTIDSDSGIVRQNAGAAALTGNKLTITYEDGTTESVNVTVSMVKNADGTAVDTSTPGTYTGLKVVYTYNGVEYTICNNYTLTVRENVQNNYPEYPDEGSVKVNKTATGIDFQSSGIAQVELSASGIPAKSGVDVIVMVDTSSSMKRGAGTNSEVSAPNRRIDFLQTAIEDLIVQFQTPGDDGETLDIRMAIAEFNGYDFISSGDHPTGTSQQTSSNVAEVFTGDGSKTASAFVQATSIEYPATFAANIGLHSGTNYDYAFDTIYRLGSSIQAANEEAGESRELFVIFMSDGAPYGYNYYGSATTDRWDDYLNGTLSTNYLEGNTHFYRTDGKHWMAEAVKGATTENFPVIDPEWDTDNALGTDASVEYGNYFSSVPGLGATLYTIGFCLYDDAQSGGTVTATTQKALMQRLASVDSQGNTLYYETESGTGLSEIFASIGNEISYAATNARFVDQMGDDYNLQLKTSTYTAVENGVEVEKPLAPVIEIGTYTIYTRQDYLDGKCTEAQIGNRTGSFTLTEVVKFSDDGTKAYSNLIDVDDDGTYGVTVNSDGTYTIADTDDNILGTDGVIYAKNFLYNTNATDVTITGVDIPTGTDSAGLTTGSTALLPSETFYWKVGTITTLEVAMRYYVYLEGSMEGTREAGSYPTNEYANLYYDNYVGAPSGKPCQQTTTSPVLAWKSANVSYAFYLVDENGNIIVNQTTGATGTFANKIAVTNPVVYKEILLNNTDQVNSIEIASLGVLPEGYELYDKGAVYEITIESNSTGGWKITNGGVATNSTYVMHYDPNNAAAYSNELSVDTIGNDYTHTVVWFAVLWKVQALPDAVVIDYGLPVDISVLTNDMFGENGKLAGVGAYSDSVNLDGYDAAMADGFGSSYTGTYGSATADASTGKVRYQVKDMQMNGYEKFAYAVNYTGTTNPGYYYDTVTVIPATTIYYEDNFVEYSSYTWDTATNGWKEKETSLWKQEGTTVEGATQAEDRPGQYSLTDANNIYGYDGVNLGMSTYSMGSAMKATVDYDNYAEANFSFYGTGFDVISMTSNTTGTIYVNVYQNGTLLEGKSFVVDTYYGYTRTDDGEWIVNPNAEDSLYQVPVMKVEGLPYGKYDIEIKAVYEPIFEHVEDSTSYDFYLDAIRIYDPANDGAEDSDTVIEDAYKADGEGWPSYIELRNKLIDAGTLGNAATGTVVTGLVFIDGNAEVGDAQIEDYVSYGPNNEVYLAPGQRVAFLLSTPDNIKNVHIGIKSANGVAATYTIKNIAQASNDETGVEAGDSYSEKTSTVNTTTDMYYDLTGYKNDIIVISNTGTEGIISITNIKSTYTSKPASSSAETQSVEDEPYETYVYMTPEAADVTLKALEPKPYNPFADVSEGRFFYESVLWAVKNGITNGISATHFGPYLECTRAQVVTFLWRAAGSPAPVSRENPFVDVPEGKWYTDAVLWAVENGITKGLTSDTFGPEAVCSRAQVVTFLWRANGSEVVSGTNPFADVREGSFCHDAVIWAVNNGITKGVTATEFDPNGTCMRAHVVTFLYRAAQLPQHEVNSES